MKIGIAIDKWKLEIFERHLSQAGYGYLVKPGWNADISLLTVTTDNKEALAGVVEAANTECARTRPGGVA